MTTPVAAPPKPHYRSIDRMRGGLALFVVVHHVWMNLHLDGRAPRGTEILFFGDYGVAGFLAISGYSLAIALFPHDRWRGVGDYIRRRARRILPTYFAALLIGIALGLTILSSKTGSHWDNALPITTEGIKSHLFLVHNLDQNSLFQIDYPMWSIAVEAQVYVLLPLLVLLLRFVREGVAFAVCALLPLLAFFFGPRDFAQAMTGLSYGLLHFGAFFMVGVAGRRWEPAFVARVSPALLQIGSLIALALAFLLGRWFYLPWRFPLDLLVSVAVILLVIGFPRRGAPISPGGGPVGALFSWLGAFSYSLYLFHAPLVELVWRYGGRSMARLPHGAPAVLLLSAAVAVGGSYVLYLLFERPFLTRKPT